MAVFEGKCPSCNAAIKITDLSFSGRKIRCPKCSTSFRLPQFDARGPEVLEEDSASIVQEQAEERSPTTSKTHLEDDEDFVDEPKSRPKRKDAVSDSAESKSSTRRQMDDDRDIRPSKRREEAKDDDKRPRKRKEEYDRPRKRRDEKEDDDRPARRSSSRARGDQKERKGKTGSSTRVIVLVCAGLFVATGLGVVIYIFASPSLKGEKEVREMITIAENTKEEKDEKKKWDAWVQKEMLEEKIRLLNLTIEEQQKLKDKYGDKLKELDIKLDKMWDYQNKVAERNKPPEQKKNDIDSLLAELNDPMTSEPNAADSLIKRITTNIPTDSPRRADVFKAVLATLKKEKLSLTDNQWLELTLRFASTKDISELTALTKEHWRWIGNKGQIIQKLIELKAPNVQSILIEDLKSSNINDRTHAAAELRKMGSSVEKEVQAVAGPENFNYDGRINAIKLLGDIGSEDSAKFLLSLKEDNPEVRDKINDAEKRIRERMKKKKDGSSTP